MISSRPKRRASAGHRPWMGLWLPQSSFKAGVYASVAINSLSKFIAFLLTIVVAHYFGATVSTDAYFVSVSLVSIVAALFVGVSTSVMVPHVVKLREGPGLSSVWPFFCGLFWSSLGLAVLLSATMYLSKDWLFQTLAGFSPGDVAENQATIVVCILVLPVMTITSLQVQLATAFKYFSLPSLTSLVSGISTICIVVSFHGRLGILSVAIGTLAGQILNLAILSVILVRRLGWRPFGRIEWHPGILAKVLDVEGAHLLNALSHSLMLAALTRVGDGVLSAWNYANQLLQLPNTLFMGQVVAVFGVKFASLHSSGAHREVGETLLLALRALLFVMAPVFFLLFLYADLVVEFVLRRGSFDETAARNTVFILQNCAIIIPLHVIFYVSTSCMTACQETRLYLATVLYSSTFLAFLYSLCLIWNGLGIFVGAIILGTVFSATASAFLLARSVYVPRDWLSKLPLWALRILVLNFVVAGLTYYIGESVSVASPLWRIGIIGLLYLAMYVLLGAATGVLQASMRKPSLPVSKVPA